MITSSWSDGTLPVELHYFTREEAMAVAERAPAVGRVQVRREYIQTCDWYQWVVRYRSRATLMNGVSV